MKAKKGLKLFLIISIVIMTLLAIGNSGWSMLPKVPESPELDPSYYISDYDINIVVTNQNTVEVEEIITAVFTMPGKHGLYRNIPLMHTMDIVENGKTKTVTQNIKDYNVEGNQNAVMTYEDGNLIIRMGDPDEFQVIEQPSVFALSYTLDLGRDYAETYDMLYYNIVGSGWQVPILNLDYKITMPKEYDINKIKMYRGRYGSRNAINTYLITRF